MAILKVYGLTEADMEKLKQIALDKTGKDSVSHLAKTLLDELANTPIKRLATPTDSNKRNGDKKRTILRLSAREKQYFQHSAEHHKMSINAFIRLILQQYIISQPILSTAELTALYQSNYQLLRIGRNINQIARHLNTMESVEFSIKHIESLQKTIDEHTQKISAMMTANKKRFAS